MLSRHSFYRVVLVSVAALSCGVSPTGLMLASSSAQTRWERHEPSAYRMTIHRSCECLAEMSGPVVVTVRDGSVISRQYVQSGAPVTSTYAELFPAVEGLFALIDRAIRDGVKPIDPRYDERWGYPIRFSLGDPAIDAPLYTITQFTPE